MIVRVRNLKVWFSQRGGLLKEMMTRGSRWVRAVDGIDLDVRRGEVFCLVGESGCGKTTTGKAILRLVDVTEGDILLEMPEGEYARYQEAVAKGTEDPQAHATARELRQKYSLTWKERRPWTAREVVLVALMVAIAGLGCTVGLTALLSLLATPFSDIGMVYAFSFGLAIAIGVVGTLPPSRPSRRTSLVLAAVSFLAWFLAPLPTFFFKRISLSPVDAIGQAWGNNFFFFILAGICVPIVAPAVAQGITIYRLRSAEYAGLDIRGLRKRLQLIFQDPYESLNPKQSVYEIVAEPLRVNRLTKSPEETAAIVANALTDTGLRPPEEFMFRFPHELSGGQRQRVSIAAGLVVQPDFIVADEPVSMLDVSIRTEILQLMMDLRKSRGLTYLFITHDLSLAWILADRIAVMYLGKIVEQGTADDVVARPKHPYTQALISVVPSPDPRHKAVRQILKGERPDPVDIPTGCRFHPRCPVAFEPCGWNAEEIAEELGQAERDIGLRIAGSIRDRRSQIQALQKGGGEPGAGSPDAEVHRLEQEIQELETSQRNAEALAAAFRPVDPHTMAVTPPAGRSPGELAENLRALVAAQKSTRVAFRAIREITETAGALSISLHEWSEPALLEVAPGNAVACHLMAARSAAAPTPETIPA